MYNKEKTYVVKALDTAIDSLSRAEHIIRRSETASKKDMELAKDMFDTAFEIRRTRNTIKELYKENL